MKGTPAKTEQQPLQLALLKFGVALGGWGVIGSHSGADYQPQVSLKGFRELHLNPVLTLLMFLRPSFHKEVLKQLYRAVTLQLV